MKVSPFVIPKLAELLRTSAAYAASPKDPFFALDSRVRGNDGREHVFPLALLHQAVSMPHMNPRMRFHLIAVTAIVVIIILMHNLLSKPQKIITVQEIGHRYVRIYQADWGLNCNPMIATALQSQSARATVRPLPGSETTPQPTLAYAEPGNVLQKISDGCGKTLECAFEASTAVLGEIHQGCPPELVIGYRCDPVERLQQRTFRVGESVKITCMP